MSDAAHFEAGRHLVTYLVLCSVNAAAPTKALCTRVDLGEVGCRVIDAARDEGGSAAQSRSLIERCEVVVLGQRHSGEHSEAS